MAFYESVWIARQDISGAQVDSLADELTQIIKDQGATSRSESTGA